MKNKGFTLIELLAVIVILAIIMVIAVPQILKVIDSARSNSANSSIALLKDGIETQIASSEITNSNPFTKDSENCYVFDFDNKNSNYQNLNVKNKDKFTGTLKYCGKVFDDSNLVFDGNSSSTGINIDLIQNSDKLSRTQENNNNHWSGMTSFEGNSYWYMWVWESTPADFWYSDKVKISSGQRLKITGKAAVYYNCGSHEKLIIGFSNTTNSTNDFVVSQELSGTASIPYSQNSYRIPASSLEANLRDFEITLNTPGEYYVKGILMQTSRSCSAYAGITELKVSNY